MDYRAEPDAGSIGEDIQDRAELDRATLAVNYPDRQAQDGLVRRSSAEVGALNRFRVKHTEDGVRSGTYTLSAPVGESVVPAPEVIDTTPL